MATLDEVSDGMAMVNGAPMPEICYVAVRGGDQIDSVDQLLKDVVLPWADEDKGKFLLNPAGHGRRRMAGGERQATNSGRGGSPPCLR